MLLVTPGVVEVPFMEFTVPTVDPGRLDGVLLIPIGALPLEAIVPVGGGVPGTDEEVEDMPRGF